MEKPILFNTSMIQAILEGRKKTTRRIIKQKYKNADIEWFTNKYGTRLVEMQNDTLPDEYNPETKTTKVYLKEFAEIKSPYQVGDILWVRETFCPDYFDFNNKYGNRIAYKADYNKNKIGDMVPEPKWKPSIFMPREAARIFLKATDVKVQRIQDILEDEAKAEGINSYTKDNAVFKYAVSDDWWANYHRKHKNFRGTWWQDMPRTTKEAFQYLWDSLYKKKGYGWDENPWVWVIKFQRINKGD